MRRIVVAYGLESRKGQDIRFGNLTPFNEVGDMRVFFCYGRKYSS